MEQPKKINCILISTKSGRDDLIGCGWCFALLDDKDKHCWNCGIEIGEDGESFLEGLLESYCLKSKWQAVKEILEK